MPEIDLKQERILESSIFTSPSIRFIISQKPGEAWLEIDGKTCIGDEYLLHVKYQPGGEASKKFASYDINSLLFSWSQEDKINMVKNYENEFLRRNALLWATLLTIQNCEKVSTLKLFSCLTSLGLHISSKELRERLELYRHNRFSVHKGLKTA